MWYVGSVPPRPGASSVPSGGFPATTRRGFLRLAGTTAAFTALSQIRALPPALYAAPLGATDRFFDNDQTEILTLLMERIVDTSDDPPGSPALPDDG